MFEQIKEQNEEKVPVKMMLSELEKVPADLRPDEDDNVPPGLKKVPADQAPAESDTDSAISFKQKSAQVREIQQHLCDLSGEYEKMLRHGHATYGGTYTEWSNPIDGLYGRRTNVALKAFFKVELGQDRANNIPVTQEDYETIMGIKQSKMSAQVASKVAPKQVVENIMRKRNYKLEKLVFERMVKGCK